MKQYLAIIAAAVLLASLSACSGKPEQPVQPETLPATIPVDTRPDSTDPTVVSMEMAEMVLVNDENCAFAVKSASQNAHVGMTLEVALENKTGKNLIFTWNNTSVNGFMFDPDWVEEVPAGQSRSSTLYFDTFRMEDFGVESVDEIAFTLFVYDSDDFMGAPLVNEPFTLYPTGLSKDTMVYPERPAVQGQQVVAETDDLTFVIESARQEGEFYLLRCYIANRTERNLLIGWEDVSVDGYRMDPLFSVAVGAQKRTVCDIGFPLADFAAAGFSQPGEIRFKLMATDFDDWEAAPILEQTSTYNP